MKYLGEKSFSSFVAGALLVFLVLMIILMVLGIPLEIYVLFKNPPEGSFLQSILDYVGIENTEQDSSLFRKILLICQAAFVAPTIIGLILRMRRLFLNFSQEILFHTSTVRVIKHIALLFLALSILTQSLVSALCSAFLLVLVAIFKQGLELQKEIDLTV